MPTQKTANRRLGARDAATEAQSMRILAAMAQLACEGDLESATVARLVKLAGVSRRTFYELYANRGDCLLAVVEEALATVSEHAGAARREQSCWIDGVRAGLHAALELFAQEPELARLCIVPAISPLPAMLARRSEVLAELTAIIDEGRGAARGACAPSPLTAEAVLGGALAVLHERLLRRERRSLVELLQPLMAMIVQPYLGNAAASRELARPAPASSSAPPRWRHTPNPLEGLNMRLTVRTMRVIAAVAERPGLSNRDVAARAGIVDPGQASKLLARLSGLGLLENYGEGQAAGSTNAWRLTPRGRQLERACASLRVPARRRAVSAMQIG